MLPWRRIAVSHVLHTSGLFSLTIIFALIAISILGLRVFDRQHVLRVAVGLADPLDADLVSKIASHMERDDAGFRFTIVPVEGPAASARALEDGRADLAVIHTDVAIPANGAVVLIFRRDLAFLFATRGSRIAHVRDLKGKRVGVFPPDGANVSLLGVILKEYAIEPSKITSVPLTDGQLAGAISKGQIDAILAVAPLRGGAALASVAEAFASAKKAMKLAPIDGAEGIAARYPAYEKAEAPPGLFAGPQPQPKDSLTTIARVVRLEASQSLSDQVVTRLTKRLLAVRRRLQEEAPIAAAMEKPDTDKGSNVFVHPGAAAYYDINEKSFMDLYGDWLYIGAMATSGLASAVAALFGLSRTRARKAALGLIDRLVEIKKAALATTELALLTELDKEVEELSAEGLRFARDKCFDSAGLSALRLAIDEARRAIDHRREEPRRFPKLVAAGSLGDHAELEADPRQ
jgi:TRAP transporter TAXI family solute receptor